MKIVREEKLISTGAYANSTEWLATRSSLHKAICEVDWPPGSGSFLIYPESGKKRGAGNGVKPIKNGLMLELASQGWKLEQRLTVTSVNRPGKLMLFFILHTALWLLNGKQETSHQVTDL